MTRAAAVRERPIIMTAESVRAILDGRKTQTRRVVDVKGRDLRAATLQDGRGWLTQHKAPDSLGTLIGSPYGYAGNRLWVRESVFTDSREANVIIYAATADFYQRKGEPVKPCTYPDTPRTGEYPTHESSLKNVTTPPTSRWWKLRPSIHMPRWASRITLEITGVRVERLHDMSAADAWAEGVRPDGVAEHPGDGMRDLVDPLAAVQDAFTSMWDSLNASRGHPWESNPFVWVLEFRKVER